VDAALASGRAAARELPKQLLNIVGKLTMLEANRCATFGR